MEETTNVADDALEETLATEPEEGDEGLGDGFLYAQGHRGGER